MYLFSIQIVFRSVCSSGLDHSWLSMVQWAWHFCFLLVATISLYLLLKMVFLVTYKRQLNCSLRLFVCGGRERDACAVVHLCGCQNTFLGASSVLPQYGTQRLNSCDQAWWQGPLPAKPSCQLKGNFYITQRTINKTEFVMQQSKLSERGGS